MTVGGTPHPTVAVLVAPDSPEPAGIEALHAEADVHVVRTADELAHVAPEARAIAVYDFRTTLVPAFVREAPLLEWVHAASAGVDAAMVPEVVDRGLTVTNSRGVFDQGIAEYVLGAVIAFCKDLPGTLQHQQQRTWVHRDTEPVAGRHLLVVGAGSIGREVGRVAAAVGMEVRGVARSSRDDDPLFGRVVAQNDLVKVLPWADFVVLTVPLTDDTRGMIDGTAIAAMRSDARLINVARGGVVDESALIEALSHGRIAGAMLDVFAAEPLPEDSPLWSMPNVIVSPHMAGDLHGWVEALSTLFVDNYRRWRDGQPLLNVIQE